jgi:adenylate kinase family enzyme
MSQSPAPASAQIALPRVLIFGNSGSGKSTLAARLAQEHGLAHLDLDSIVWEPDKIAVQRSPAIIAQLLNDFLTRQDRWVIEGCYGEWVQAAAGHCSELVFLNPGMEACLAHNLQRPWEPHKYASRAEQDARLADLQAWVAGYYQRKDQWSYFAHRAIFDDFPGHKSEHFNAMLL